MRLQTAQLRLPLLPGLQLRQGEQPADLGQHAVEAAAKQSDFIRAVAPVADRQIAGLRLAHEGSELADRAGNRIRQIKGCRHPKHTDHKHKRYDIKRNLPHAISRFLHRKDAHRRPACKGRGPVDQLQMAAVDSFRGDAGGFSEQASRNLVHKRMLRSIDHFPAVIHYGQITGFAQRHIARRLGDDPQLQIDQNHALHHLRLRVNNSSNGGYHFTFFIINMGHDCAPIRMSDNFEYPFIINSLLVPCFISHTGFGAGIHFITDEIAFTVDQHNSGNFRAKRSKALQKLADIILCRFSACACFLQPRFRLLGAIQKSLHPRIKRNQVGNLLQILHIIFQRRIDLADQLHRILVALLFDNPVHRPANQQS